MKLRNDYTIDKSTKGFMNTPIAVTWLIETKEYPGRFCLVEGKVEWETDIKFASIVKTNVKVEMAKDGLWDVSGGMKPLMKLR